MRAGLFVVFSKTECVYSITPQFHSRYKSNRNASMYPLTHVKMFIIALCNSFILATMQITINGGVINCGIFPPKNTYKFANITSTVTWKY